VTAETPSHQRAWAACSRTSGSDLSPCRGEQPVDEVRAVRS